ncbi:MAG: L-ribulose-5-phosphate 4-epimerase [Clostridiales bacterium]|nr:L-ribulose-5-phosphate 4-epimerase [Clostridiales bacterium]
MLEALKERVWAANLELQRQGLVLFTWGNVSAVDRDRGLVVIKPSGVDYDKMKPEDMVVVDFDGKVAEGRLNPSSDTPTHLELYMAFEQIGGIAHTHSRYATVFAQSGKEIPALGTTHADYFYGGIPCTRALTESETAGDYEKNTGLLIAETFHNQNGGKLDPGAIPACLVKHHGPFTWGKTCQDAVFHAAVLEYCAQMALMTELLAEAPPMPKHLLDRHYLRKHGKNAYYGQKEQ